MTRILIGAEFVDPVSLPGLKSVSRFPPGDVGWRGTYEGWSMRVVGSHLEIWSPPGGLGLSAVGKAECEANGIPLDRIISGASIPLDRCTLRWVGDDDAPSASGVDAMAPSAALLRAAMAPPPVPVVAAPVDGTAPTVQDFAPKPANRRPPGAKPNVVPPSVVTDLSEGETKAAQRRVDGMVVE